MIKSVFTIGPLEMRHGAGLTIATAGLARALARMGEIDVTVFGRGSEDAGQSPMWAGVAVHSRGGVGPRWLDWDRGLPGAICAVRPQVVHTHGLWLAHQRSAWRAAKQVGVPRLVTPHGQLDGWALRRSSFKKRVAWQLYQRASLRQAACLQALNESEARAFRRAGLTNPVCVVPNGIDRPADLPSPPPPPWHERIGAHRKVLLFMGRIGEQKGAIELASVWAELNAQSPNEMNSWCLAIVGWAEGDAVEQIRCIAAAGRLMTDSLLVLGPQVDAAKASCLAHAAAFVLPSKSEGLPMAILEAWSHGLPVAMTAACNLPLGFMVGAASEIRLGPTLSSDLLGFLNLPRAELQSMGARGRELTETVFSWDRIAQQMLNVYRWCLGVAAAPASLMEENPGPSLGEFRS